MILSEKSATFRDHALGEGSLTEKVVTALCLAFLFWAVLFGGPMVGKGGRLSGDAGKIARLGY